MPAATYGVQNPGGTDPWPIEQVLAPLATAGSAANAQTMLFDYKLAREADANVYNQSMQQQHEFAKQQLAQQLYEAQLKAVPDYLGKPGGAQLLGPGGIPGLSMGADPATIAKVQAAGLAHEQSMNLAEAGKGIEGASAGGLQIAPEGVSALQGLNVTNLGTNARVQAELIRQQTELQKQKMKGAGGGATGLRWSGQAPNDPAMPDFVFNWSGRGPLDQIKRQLLEARPDRAGVKAPDTGASTPPTGGRTSLPQKGAAPGAGVKQSNAAPGVDPAQRTLNDHLERVIRTKNEGAYKDIKAAQAKNGGVIPVTRDAQGKPVVVGASGTVYK